MKIFLVKDETEKEINLDTDKPFIIGRGTIPGCADKKVSRNHGELQLTPEGNISLKALHSNPCFVMQNGLPPLIPIAKNNEKIISDGDYIGLLPKAYWYKVVVKGNESVGDADGNLDNSKLEKVTEKNESKNDSENESKTQVDNKTVDNKIDDNKIDDNKVDDNKIDSEKPKKPEPITSGESGEKTDKAPVSDNDESVDEEAAANDDLEKRLKALEHTKKLPLEKYDLYQQPGDSDFENFKEKSGPMMKDNKKEGAKKYGKKNKKYLGKIRSFPAVQQPVEEEREFRVGYLQLVPDAEECGLGATRKKSAEKNKQENGWHTGREPRERSVDDSVLFDGPITHNRPVCKYEGRCYRKNYQHKKYFSHPGDPDFVPYFDRPMCAFGPACYNQSKNHYITYRHLTENKKMTQGKRRGPEVKYAFDDDDDDDDDDEDDSDFDDFFPTDGSSDEFFPNDNIEENGGFL